MSDDRREAGAWGQALAYLARRPRSEAQVQEYLRNRGIPGPVSDRVIRRLRERGWIDDVAFARRWLERRVETGRASLRQAEWELVRQGVRPEDIEAALAALPEGGEARAAVRWLRAHRDRHRGDDLAAWRAKAYRGLVQKGFRPDLAFRAVMDWKDEERHQGG
ncbi:MAG: RecX family transcriptional regulator [Kyrpidia sp.]|nr:RecX family transcriptional regulator [Kyrpidia sp.]